LWDQTRIGKHHYRKEGEETVRKEEVVAGKIKGGKGSKAYTN
jgi:hypothetical protein